MSCLKRLPQSGVGSSSPHPPRPRSGVQATPSPYRLGAGGQTLRTWHHCSVACPILVSRDMGQLRSRDPQARRVQTPSTGTQESSLSVTPPPTPQPILRTIPEKGEAGDVTIRALDGGAMVHNGTKTSSPSQTSDAAAACVLINPFLSTSLPFPTVSPFAQAACRISPFPPLHPPLWSGPSPSSALGSVPYGL